MNKNLYKIPLKMTGNRILFIVITWVFSVTLTVVLDLLTGGNNIGIYYSIATSIPYLMLIYYEAFDAGHLERNKETASVKNAFLYCLFWQIPSLIFFCLYLLSFISPLSTGLISNLFGGIWLAPFIGPRGISANENSNIIQFIIFMAAEWGFFLVSYYMGMKDIVLIKPKKKKSNGSMKK